MSKCGRFCGAKCYVFLGAFRHELAELVFCILKRERYRRREPTNNTRIMLELEYLVLREYHLHKEFDTDEFYTHFIGLYKNIFSLEEIKTALANLDVRGYLESSKNKFHTLNISEEGERLYKVNGASLRWVGLFVEIFKDYDSTITYLIKQKYPKEFEKVWVKYHSGGYDFEGSKKLFIQDLLRLAEHLPAKKKYTQSKQSERKIISHKLKKAAVDGISFITLKTIKFIFYVLVAIAGTILATYLIYKYKIPH